MEKVSDRVSVLSAGQTDELVTRLTSFMRLYGERRGRLQSAARGFTLAAAGQKDAHESEELVRGLLVVFGGVLGAACGGATGGCWGAAGAVSTASVVRLCGDINAVEASIGFVGGVCGGVVGGAFGGAVGSVAEVRGGRGAVSNVAWFAIGFATGGAIGGVFGDVVGAAGGAFGGGFGALYAMRFAVSLVGGIAGLFCEAKRSNEQVTVRQKSGEFRETIEPLVEELKTIKTICVKMASSVVARGLADQSAKSLASAIEKSISDCQRAADPTQFGSDVEEATRQSKKIVDDLETTRAEVENLLVSLSEHQKTGPNSKRLH